MASEGWGSVGLGGHSNPGWSSATKMGKKNNKKIKN